MAACILKAIARASRREGFCLTDGLRSDLLSRRLNLTDLPDGGDEEYTFDQHEGDADDL
jgi:hypothetical protein